METYYEFAERCRRRGVKANYTDATLGDFFVLSADEAAVTAQLGFTEEEFLEAAGGLAKFQDDRRHRRQEEEQDSPELRAVEEEYAAALGVSPAALSAQQPTRMLGAPDRGAGEGEGPYDRLIIRGATVIDGTGAPPIGPMDIVIEGNRIVSVRGVGAPNVPIDEGRRPALDVDGNPDAVVHEIDATGMYVLPGFVDLHLHTGGVPKAPEAERSTRKITVSSRSSTKRLT